MPTKTTSKKTTTKKTPAKKPAAKKAPRMSASAARVEGAAKMKREMPSAPPTANAKPQKAKRLSGLDHAATVLAAAKEPLAAKTIAERAIAAGWTTNGKTPHATLYAAMTREITAKGKDARFAKVERGLFTVTTR